MSLIDIKPEDCPAELRLRIEKYAQAENLTWEQAIISLAHKVVSPTRVR